MPAKLYDWDRWFEKRRFTIYRGEDYDCTQSAIVQQIRNKAVGLGKLVELIDNNDSITVIVTDKVKSQLEHQ